MAEIKVFIHNQLPDGVTLRDFKKGRSGSTVRLDPSPTLPDYEIISGYRTLDDIKSKLNAILANRPNDVLGLIDHSAHGNPISHNSLGLSDVANWASYLKTLPWADEARIYLSGCNTGISLDRSLNFSDHGPIAERLAQAIPFNPQTFAHKITVFGTVGFCYGSMSIGIRTEREVIELVRGEQAVRLGRSIIRIPGRRVRIVHAAYPDGKTANGTVASYNAFPNW